MMWNENVPEVDHNFNTTVHLYELDDGRCKATSWGPAHTKLPQKPKYENHFGPGGFNRCIGGDRHRNELHKDEWGHVFSVDGSGGVKVKRIEAQ